MQIHITSGVLTNIFNAVGSLTPIEALGGLYNIYF